MKPAIRSFLHHTSLLAIGSALCAIAVNGILIPNEFLSNGMTGVALLVFYKFPVLPVGALYLLLNVPVFLLGWVFVGARFILFTAWGMVIYSLMLVALPIDLGITDKMLGAFVGGGMVGVGVAIMLRSYGAAGGSEILVVIMNKLFGMTVGTGTIIFNTVLLVVSLLLFPLANVLYTMIFVFVSAFFTDMVFHGLVTRQVVLIISGNWAEVFQEMIGVKRWGATLIKGSSGVDDSERTIIYSVVKRHEVPAVKALVLAKDPNAFIAIMDAADVTGRNVGNQPLW